MTDHQPSEREILSKALDDHGFKPLTKLVGKYFGRVHSIVLTDNDGNLIAKIGDAKPEAAHKIPARTLGDVNRVR